MNHYEGMFILKPDLDKDSLDKLLSQAKELIEKNKGSIDQIKEWGKQKLAYPIEKYKEGVYYLLDFHIVPEAITKIRSVFSLNESILRILIVKI